MKVTFSVWIDESCHRTEEHIIESFDFQGILEDFGKAVELRRLRAQVQEFHRAVRPKTEKP